MGRRRRTIATAPRDWYEAREECDGDEPAEKHGRTIALRIARVHANQGGDRECQVVQSPACVARGQLDGIANSHEDDIGEGTMRTTTQPLGACRPPPRLLAPCSVALLLTTLSPVGANAQVNVERLRKSTESNGLLISAQGSFTGRVGNVEGTIAGGSLQIQGVQNRHWALAFVSGDYGTNAHVKTISRSFLHGRYNYRLLDWLLAEVYLQEQTDKFRRLQLRSLTGSGARFAVVQEDDVQLYLGTGYFYEHEVIDVLPGASDAPTQSAHRWSNYATIVVKVQSKLSVVMTTYVQPRFDQFQDYRLLHEAIFNFEINKQASAGISATWRRDSDPPTGVKPTDVEIRNTLTFTF